MGGADAARRGAGLGFVTSGVVMASEPTAHNFPDDKGFYKVANTGGKRTLELQDSDVVCFRSAASDADGYHSLINSAGVVQYAAAR